MRRIGPIALGKSAAAERQLAVAAAKLAALSAVH